MTKLSTYLAASIALLGLTGNPLQAGSGNALVGTAEQSEKSAQWSDDDDPAYSGYPQFGGSGYGQWPSSANQPYGGFSPSGSLSPSYREYGQGRHGCHHGGCRQGASYGYSSGGNRAGTFGGNGFDGPGMGGYGSGQWSRSNLPNQNYGISNYGPPIGFQPNSGDWSPRYSPAFSGNGQQFSPATNNFAPAYPIQQFQNQSLGNSNSSYIQPPLPYNQQPDPFGQQSVPYGPRNNSYGPPQNGFSPTQQPVGQSGGNFYQYQSGPNLNLPQQSPFYP